jgi:hypothetical protein
MPNNSVSSTQQVDKAWTGKMDNLAVGIKPFVSIDGRGAAGVWV